jgi:hypothetical protein
MEQEQDIRPADCAKTAVERESDRLVLTAQSFGEDTHHLEREHRHVLDQEEELPFLDRRHGDVSQGNDGGAARTVVDQRHFAENAFRAQSFEATVAAPYLDLSAHDDKELVTSFALAEDRVSGREVPGRDLRPQEKTEINLVA